MVSLRIVAHLANDEWVDRLRRLFAEHPAWLKAAHFLSRDAASTVFFRHRPGEAWRLEKSDGRPRLTPGASPDPDLVFRFDVQAIERLESVVDGIGAFAIELFSLITQPDPERRLGFRVVASFPRLVRRGYLQLLLASGPRVLAFGAARGIRSPRALRRLVERLRARSPEPWESACEKR